MGVVSRPPRYVPAQQADAVISQANPVSATLYEVLSPTRNCRILSIVAAVTWTVTQPTPLDIVVTIDGNTLLHRAANPASASNLQATMSPAEDSAAGMTMINSSNAASDRPFLVEGRSVRVQVRVTWAVTQPTPLVCRVKYAKW